MLEELKKKAEELAEMINLEYSRRYDGFGLPCKEHAEVHYCSENVAEIIVSGGVTISALHLITETVEHFKKTSGHYFISTAVKLVDGKPVVSILI